MASLGSMTMSRQQAMGIIQRAGAIFTAKDPTNGDIYWEYDNGYGAKLYYVSKPLPDGNILLSVSATCNCRKPVQAA